LISLIKRFSANAEDTEDRARRYNRAHRYLSLAGFLLSLAWLAALLFLGWSAGLRDVAWQVSARYSPALAVYLLLVFAGGKLLGLPLGFYAGYVIEHRYGLSNQTVAGWVKDEAKSVVLGGALSLAAAELLYALLRWRPDWWWLAAWAGFLLFVVLMANLGPVLLFPLFYKFQPLADEELKQRLLRLSERAGARVRGVFEWKLSEKSRKANAALAGWGNTRRIILADTLLQQYTPDEVEAVLAHELAHHVHHHIGKSLALQSVAGLAGFWLADRALRTFGSLPRFGFRGIGDFANLPLLLLLAAVLSLLLLPAVNAISRHFERQADDYAFRAIPDVGPFISSMEKLAAQNLAERRPNRAIEFIFHSHPSMEKRIRRALAHRETT
jgi:STE24 endopeptidase